METADDDNAPATRGDLRGGLRDLETRMNAKIDTLATMFGELAKTWERDLARHASAIMEEMKTLFGGSTDKETRLEERLDAHVADTTVHLSAAPARGGRASRTRRRR